MNTDSRPRLGIVGALAVLVATAAAAATLPTEGVAAWLLLLNLMALWLAPAALRRMAGPQTLLILLLLGGASWLGQTLAGSAEAPDPAALALHIVMRVGAMLLALGLVAYSLPLEQFAAGLERLGLKGFGFALGVAVNSLPVALRTLHDTRRALKLRRPWARGRLRAWRLAATTVVARMLGAAEDTVAAAQARGYDPRRRTNPPVAVGAGDIVLAAVSLAVVTGCAWFALL